MPHCLIGKRISATSISGYYLTLMYGDGFPIAARTRRAPNPIVEERNQAVERLAAAGRSADEWALVEASIGLRETKSRLLIRVQ